MSTINLFDWSLIDRYSIANYIWTINQKIVGKDIDQKHIHNKISYHLKKQLPIRVRQKFSKDVRHGIIFVGGMYLGDHDQDGKFSIEIDLYYNSKKDRYILDSKRFWKLCICIADTLLHELIHMRQYRRRNFKDLPAYSSTAQRTDKREEQNYLGCSDEVDAYAFNIACELTEKFKGDQQLIVKYLDENQKNKKRKNNCWRMYLKAFEHNHNHEIIKKLKKKVIYYLPYAKIGKPYKNNDWIIG